MSRNSKFSAEDKLRIINEMKNIDVDMVAKNMKLADLLCTPGNLNTNIRALKDYVLLIRINTIPRSSKPIWSNNIKHRIIR